MPTAHRRHAITETEEIAQALSAARRAWPEIADKPNALLRRLILAGEHSIDHDRERERNRRRGAIAEARGALTVAFPPGYLDEIRADWPQ